jgi:hypothetical protein
MDPDEPRGGHAMITNAIITNAIITSAIITSAMITSTDIDMFGTTIDIDAASIRNVSTDLASGTAGC